MKNAINMGIDNNSIIVLDKFLRSQFGVKNFFDNEGLLIKSQKKITSIGLTTSLRIENINFFHSQGINTIISHHGVGSGLVKEKREKSIIDKHMNLFVIHEDFDCNKYFGHNILLIKKFFPYYKNLDFNNGGVNFSLKNLMNVDDIVLAFKSYGLFEKGIFYGKKEVSKIGIIAGGGEREAVYYFLEKEVDLFITCEITERSISDTMDLQKNYIVLDHYKTELIGMKFLSMLIESKLKIKTCIK